MKLINFIDLINYISNKIKPIYIDQDNIRFHAWLILCYVMKKTQAQIISEKNIDLNEEAREYLDYILDRHVNNNMPLQYIFGNIPFLDIKININPPILIPRYDTEYWCSKIIEKIKEAKKEELLILDIGTGSGCIALSMAKVLPKSKIYAVDINPQACELVKENASINDIRNINIIESNLFERIPKNIRFDLIVSNPPYLSQSEWLNLKPIVKDWEDPRALIAQNEGCEIIKKIIEDAPNWINKNANYDFPNLVIEIGYTQADMVKKIFSDNNYKDISHIEDLGKNIRAICGKIY